MKHKHVLKNLDGSDIEFIDIKAFGHEFKELLPGHASDLITLEKEGAIYVKHFDEKIEELEKRLEKVEDNTKSDDEPENS